MGNPGRGIPYDDASNTNQVVLLTDNEQTSLGEEGGGSSMALPLGAIIGITVGAALLALLLIGLVVRKRRGAKCSSEHLDNSNLDEDMEANEVNADCDAAEVWLDEDDDDNRSNNSDFIGDVNVRGSKNMGSAATSSLAAMGVASTVATRLSTGDTEVMVVEKQVWSKREPEV